MEPYVCIAPGQNAQYVGMGSDLYNSQNAQVRNITRTIFDTASRIVGYDLSDLCIKGPKDKLDQTLHTQPALLTHSTVCYEVFKALHQETFEREFDFSISAGASLGEYFALMIAGVMDFEATLGLVNERAKAMDAVIKDPNYDAGRQLCLNVDARTIDEVFKGFDVEQSNCNYDGQTVVGGTAGEIQGVKEYLLQGIKSEATRRLRAMDMDTEAAFHTSLMVPARRTFAHVVSKTEFSNPVRLVVSNYTGHFYEGDGSDLKMNLIYQINSPVRWQQGMLHIMKRLRESSPDQRIAFFEFGGGKPDRTDPAEQRANFGGITSRNLKSLGVDKDVDSHACISEKSILATIEALKSKG